MTTIDSSKSIISKLFWWLPFGKVAEISATELAEKMNNPDLCPQLLDVRTQTEWHKGHLTDSVNIPITELLSKIDKFTFFKKDKPIVAICLSAHRSIPAVRLLRRHGFQDVTQLAGGMLAWRRHNLPET